MSGLDLLLPASLAHQDLTTFVPQATNLDLLARYARVALPPLYKGFQLIHFFS